MPALLCISTPAELVAFISGVFIRVAKVGLVSMTGLPVPVGVEFFKSLPVVVSNKAGTQSVEDAGHTTSPEPHVITILPLQRIEVELIVLMFVQDTRVSCLADSRVLVSVSV